MRKQERKYSQSGIALVSVMILLLLVVILGTSIVRLSFLSYSRKSVQKSSDENFYAAEGAVDEVQVILQDAMTNAVNTLTNKRDRKAYIEAINTYITAGGSLVTTDPATGQKSYTGITQNIFNKMDVETMKSIGTPALYQNLPANKKNLFAETELRGGNFEVYDLVMDDSSEYKLSLGIRVTYVDEYDFTSEIDTYIVLRAPYYAGDDRPVLGSYSMMCGQGVDFKADNYVPWLSGNPSNQTAYQRHEGNIYIGAKKDGAGLSSVATQLYGGITVEFSGENVSINGDIIIKDKSALVLNGKNVDIRGTIKIESGACLIIGPQVNNIVLKDIEVGGNSIVSGTATLPGNAKISNQYYPLTEACKNGGDIQSKWDRSNMTTFPGNILIYSEDAYYTATSDSNHNLIIHKPYVMGGTEVSPNTVVSEIVTDPSQMVSKTIQFQNHDEFKQKEAVNGYDYRIAEVINVDYLEKYCNTTNDKVAGMHVISNSTTYSLDDHTSLAVTDVNDPDYDKGIRKVDNSTSLTGGMGDAATYKYLDENGTVQSKGVDINIGTNLNVTNTGVHLYVALEDLYVPLNANDQYSGIYLSAKSATFSAKEGMPRGNSFLSLDKSPNYELAKLWCEKVGGLVSKWQSDWAWTDEANCRLVNNIFRGGYPVLYADLTGGTPSGGGGIKLTSDDLISVEGWNKE